tara:strand:- start:605 stop:928 length:324 start_codon:yes stop_codon:yes gene_type:complete
MRLWRVEGLNNEQEWVGIAYIAGRDYWYSNTDVGRPYGWKIMNWLRIPMHVSGNIKFWFTKDGIQRFVKEDLPTIRLGGFKIRYFCVELDPATDDKIDEYQYIRNET